ncbi:uncharacterized protein DS421_16g566910 [Arachis hypogaea]|nr:uncharacterized protein DS421_16g566910 [Arachis hypogaea]
MLSLVSSCVGWFCCNYKFGKARIFGGDWSVNSEAAMEPSLWQNEKGVHDLDSEGFLDEGGGEDRAEASMAEGSGEVVGGAAEDGVFLFFFFVGFRRQEKKMRKTKKAKDKT